MFSVSGFVCNSWCSEGVEVKMYYNTQQIANILRCHHFSFRALSRRALENMDFPSSGYGIESDMLSHFSARGLKISEAPISVTYEVPHKHKMNPIKHGLSVLSGILQLFTIKRPILCFGVPGFIIGVVGFVLACMAFDVAFRTGVWATTMTLMAAILLMMSMLLCSVALILFSISKLVQVR